MPRLKLACKSGAEATVDMEEITTPEVRFTATSPSSVAAEQPHARLRGGDAQGLVGTAPTPRERGGAFEPFGKDKQRYGEHRPEVSVFHKERQQHQRPARSGAPSDGRRRGIYFTRGSGER